MTVARTLPCKLSRVDEEICYKRTWTLRGSGILYIWKYRTEGFPLYNFWLYHVTQTTVAREAGRQQPQQPPQNLTLGTVLFVLILSACVSCVVVPNALYRTGIFS